MRERGATLVWAMLIVLAASALAALVVERDQTMRRNADTDVIALQALHAADGGLAHIRNALATDPEYAGETVHIGACAVDLTVRRIGNDRWYARVHAAPGNHRVDATLAKGERLPRITKRIDR